MARQALLRKKNHETALDHTHSQIITLEQQINAIESANINRETLAAMQAAAKAMESIHHNLTPEKVDQTMYVIIIIRFAGLRGTVLTHLP